MSLKASLLFAMQGLAVCYADRQDPRKQAQLETIAEAITVATERTRWRGDRVSLAALLLTIAYHESKLCLDVHAGKRGMNGALTLWQLERGSRLTGYRAGLSLEDTISAAVAAATLLARSFQCGSAVDGMLRAYAGAKCGVEFPTLRARVRTFHYLRSRMARVEAAAS